MKFIHPSEIRPSESNVFNWHNPKGVELLTRLRIGLVIFVNVSLNIVFKIHLNQFLTMTTIIETSAHFLQHWSYYLIVYYLSNYPY